MKEHCETSASALFRHSTDYGHTVDYENPQILARDNIKSRLYTKESLLIKDLRAYMTHNGNTGSIELKLW